MTRGNCPAPHTPSARLLLLLDLVDLGRLSLHLTGTGQRSVNLPHGLERLYVLSRRERTRDEGSTQNHPNIGVIIYLKAFLIRGKIDGFALIRSMPDPESQIYTTLSAKQQRQHTTTFQPMATINIRSSGSFPRRVEKHVNIHTSARFHIFSGT